VACVQEIGVPIRQGEWIVERVNAAMPVGSAQYALHQANKMGPQGLVEGIGIITRLTAVGSEKLDLQGGDRVGQRARLRTEAGVEFDVYNTHLHHKAESAELRLRQARRILDWMADSGDRPGIFAGDLNARPEEAPIALIRERMRSAYAVVHGREPEGTVPTPLNAEWGQAPKTIDYVFVSHGVQVHDAHIVFDRVDALDERLCASDHYGIVADVSFD
jgi:endonuclease/exonuclease/phosphatase family metal-dependent hydrolase